MQNKLTTIFIVCTCFALALARCSKATQVPSAEQEPTSTPIPSSTQEETVAEDAAPVPESDEKETNRGRTITDLAGNTVVIPPVSEINRVVIIAPPLLATYIKVMKDTSKLVGVNSMSYAQMNQELLSELVPNIDEIDTSFLTGFTSNTEELLKLEPDIILVYGDFQKEGLENVDIPIVDFFITDQQNEIWSVVIDTMMREIFSMEDDDSLTNEWEKANTKVGGILEQVQDLEAQKGLMIMSNTGDNLTVRGAGTYGDDWLLKSGLVNAAGEIAGDSIEVSMEQIYEWNPDIVYVFTGLPASDYLDGAIDGQDWSQVNAFKSGRFYDTPRGMMNWGAPCSDSPLMLQWMAGKNFPDYLPESEFIAIMEEYYETYYGITLSNDLVSSILNPNAGK